MNENKYALAIKLECNTNFCFLVLGHPFQNELFSGKLFSLMSKCSNSNKIHLSFGSRLIASRGPTDADGHLWRITDRNGHLLNQIKQLKNICKLFEIILKSK